MKDSVSWFEIPTTDIDRAQAFYEAVFQVKLQTMDFPMIKMRVFPITDQMTGVTGALVDSGGFHIPSETQGPLIYLNANPDVQIFFG